MALMGAALSDISSNARLKVYPATEVLQVSNAPIFRAPGWEPQKRSYDVPAKGKGIDRPGTCFRGVPCPCKGRCA